jgi:glycerol-3-phosphate acyltransferase PlsY
MKLLFPLIGYLSSSIPYGFIIAKIKGKDIRNFGSGNIGATNVFRFDKKLGIITGILDILKSFVPTFLALKFSDFFIASITGLLGILGHAFTPFLRFKGGKSVSCTFGAYLALSPLQFLISFIFYYNPVLFLGSREPDDSHRTLPDLLSLLWWLDAMVDAVPQKMYQKIT